MGRRNRRPVVGCMQGGAIMGHRRRNQLGFSPISSQLHQVSGLQVSLPFTVSSGIGTGEEMGKGSMVGPSYPPAAQGSH